LSSQKTPAHHRSLLGDIRSGSPTIPRGSGGWSVGLLTGPSEGASFCPALADLKNSTPRLSAPSNRPPTCRVTRANLPRLRSMA
jgi:hypothetical protein